VQYNSETKNVLWVTKLILRGKGFAATAGICLNIAYRLIP